MPALRRLAPFSLVLWLVAIAARADDPKPAPAPAPVPAPAAATSEPIRYTVRFPAPESHYVEILAAIPTSGAAEVELYMPIWTPGSYLVREYSRNVETVTAQASTGGPVAGRCQDPQEPLADHDRAALRSSTSLTASIAAR